jgi:hypothetical protein
MGIIYFADADKRKTKKQMQENFHLPFAAPVAVTYNGKGGGEKRESYNFNNKYFKPMNRPYLR